MTELFGPLPHHDIAAFPLIVAALVPLAAAGVTALLVRREGDAEEHGALAGRVAAGGTIIAGLIAAVALVGALRSPSGVVVSSGWVLARVGSIDGALGFDADVVRAAVALALAAAGTVLSLRGGTRSARGAAAISLAVASGIAAVLSDGLATSMLGLAGALTALAWAARGARWAGAAASMVMVLIAGTTLAWGLEGQWLRGLSGEYLSDYAPRFAAVRDAPPKGPRPRGAAVADGRGSLSMTSTPGAEVYVGIADDASLRTRRTPLAVAPFRGAEVSAVLQKVAIVPGAAAVIGGEGFEVALADAVDVRAGDEIVITPLGATWTYRDLDAQLALADVEGKHPLRSAIAAKTLGGAAVPSVVLLLLFAGALAALVDAPRALGRAFGRIGRGETALVAAALGLAAVTPAARVGVLVPLAGAAALVTVALLVVAAAVAAARGRGVALGPAMAVGGVGAGLVAIAADAPVAAAPLSLLGAVAAYLVLPASGGLTEVTAATPPAKAKQTAAKAASAASSPRAAAEAEPDEPTKKPAKPRKKLEDAAKKPAGTAKKPTGSKGKRAKREESR